MGFSTEFHFANAQTVAPVPRDDPPRALREEILDVYAANNADLLSIVVTLRREHKPLGLFLSIAVTDDVLADKPVAFAQMHEENTEHCFQTVMTFRMNRRLIEGAGTPIDTFEKMIRDNSLYRI